MHPDAITDGAQNARWVCGACHAGAVQRDASPQRHIEILLPPQTERRDVMNAPSCFRRERSHRFLHHLTETRFRDGSSFFPLISFTLFFSLSSQYAKDLRTKLSSLQGLEGGPRGRSELQIYRNMKHSKTPASFNKDALREHPWAGSPCCCLSRTRPLQKSYRRSLMVVDGRHSCLTSGDPASSDRMKVRASGDPRLNPRLALHWVIPSCDRGK